MASFDLHYRRAQPRPHNMKLWLGRLETPAPQPQKQPIAPPPAPKAKGAKGIAAQFAAAMRGLLGHDWDVPPPPSSMGLDPILGNRKYWMSDPEPA